MPLISFENSQYLIDTVVLAVVLILTLVDLADPGMEYFGLQAVALDHQRDVGVLLTEGKRFQDNVIPPVETLCLLA